jgi:Transposase IS66 family
MRYGGGLPWHRQAGLQAMGGAPLAEATMWERCEATADAAMRVFLHLMRLAAGGEVMHTDDTWVRILSCMKEDKEEKGRATQTSGIVVKAGGRKIALYLSGRRHAGENLAELLTMGRNWCSQCLFGWGKKWAWRGRKGCLAYRNKGVRGAVGACGGESGSGVIR